MTDIDRAAKNGTRVGHPDPETVAVAHFQGRRLARVARVIGIAQEKGLLDIRRRIVRELEAGV
jgi:hypothetical protein